MKKILFVPMNWGLGHATRCAELIHREVQKGNQVFIAGSGPSGEWLRQYFPGLVFLEGCPGYPVKYTASGVTWFSLLAQWPAWEWTILQENRWLKKQHLFHQFDEIISDNRFGIFLPNVSSIFITHQTSPIMPNWMSRVYQKLFWKRMKRFAAIWIPDVEDESFRLSGKLSHFDQSFPVVHIGWLSRFNIQSWPIQNSEFEWVGWISGPEMQRTILERELMRLFLESGRRCLIISGQPHLNRSFTNANVDLVSHLNDQSMFSVLKSAEKIYMRPGYSSLMDLKAIHTNAELIFFPTSGQTEQEYLAKRWFEVNQ
jgi:hypothetical protein